MQDADILPDNRGQIALYKKIFFKYLNVQMFADIWAQSKWL